MPDVKKMCPFCGAEMALHYTGWFTLREKMYLPEAKKAARNLLRKTEE